MLSHSEEICLSDLYREALEIQATVRESLLLESKSVGRCKKHF